MLSTEHGRVFEFRFDMPYTEISAVCTESMLVDVDKQINREDGSTSLFYETGSALCWSPFDENGNLVSEAVIHFTVHTGTSREYAGTLYLTSTGEDSSRPIYTASLSGTGLHLSQNPEYDGGMISLVSSISNESLRFRFP